MEGTDFDIVLQAQKFEEAIDELREKSEQEVAQFKVDLEMTYKDRVRDQPQGLVGWLDCVLVWSVGDFKILFSDC